MASHVPRNPAAAKERAAKILEAPEIQRVTLFEDLAIDSVAAIAEGAEEPQELCREVLRCGAEVYGDPEMWITWDDKGTNHDH